MRAAAEMRGSYGARFGLLGVLLVLSACRGEGAAWREAEARWRRGETVAAWRAWTALDPRSVEGAEAHRRLKEADAHYRKAIALLGEGDVGVREEIAVATKTAP